MYLCTMTNKTFNELHDKLTFMNNAVGKCPHCGMNVYKSEYQKQHDVLKVNEHFDEEKQK